MTPEQKRRRFLATSAGLSLLALGYGASFVAAQAAAPRARVVKISAKRFAFTPAHLTLKKEVPVILELTSLDVLMGFNLPDFNLRADMLPGKATRDGAQAIELLMPHKNGTVFYGHIHQEHHHATAHIAHHAAKGLMFALPAPGSQPNRTPVPWDPAQPYKGLGFRGVDADVDEVRYAITEFPVVKA